MSDQEQSADRVQTAREGRPPHSEGCYAILALGPSIRVVPADSEREAELRREKYRLEGYGGAGWSASSIPLSDHACKCGCGLPTPEGQLYADPDLCRKVLYRLYHPVLDLGGMTPEQAKKAARMADEAVLAAKLGQGRATVDAGHPVTHKAVEPDSRPSNRVRLATNTWKDLEALQAHAPKGLSKSEIVRQLVEREYWTMLQVWRTRT